MAKLLKLFKQFSLSLSLARSLALSRTLALALSRARALSHTLSFSFHKFTRIPEQRPYKRAAATQITHSSPPCFPPPKPFPRGRMPTGAKSQSRHTMLHPNPLKP